MRAGRGGRERPRRRRRRRRRRPGRRSTVPIPRWLRQRTLVSLRSGIERDYIGPGRRATSCGCSRPSENPGELIWEAIAYGAPRAEFGWGHSIASATDCLSMVDLYEGDQRALPIVQGIAGIAESERDRPVNALPAAGGTADADRPPRSGRRRGRGHRAGAGARARRDRARRRGDDAAAVVHRRRQRPPAVVRPRRDLHAEGVRAARHDRLGSGGDRCCRTSCRRSSTAPARTSCPYMRPFMKALAGLDLGDARRRSPVGPGWADDGTLRATLLGPDRGPTAARGRRRAAGRRRRRRRARHGRPRRERSDAALRHRRRVRLRRRLRLARHHPRVDVRQRATRWHHDRVDRRGADHARPRAARDVHGVPRPVDRAPRVAHRRR